MRSLKKIALGFSLCCAAVLPSRADSDVYLLGVPDYNWYAGCFGTASGNLVGYWDRHGFPDFYTGPTSGGVAPLNNCGTNIGIRSMWASKAGFDGRPANKPGHIDDYWSSYAIDFANCGQFDSYSYESTATDPYVTAGRLEHAPDCVGDFIGLSQKKWTNQNGECDGNVDAYSFVYWDGGGNRRTNYTPSTVAGSPARDIQSGLRTWTQSRGYDAAVMTQLADVNLSTPAGKGFTFEDVKVEINAGYPLMVFLQSHTIHSRVLGGMTRANPIIHGMTIYGYQEVPAFGLRQVRVRTSWGSGDGVFYDWDSASWVPPYDLPIRGAIVYHPQPQVREFTRAGNVVTMRWDGPASQLYDANTGATSPAHRYQVERSSTLRPGSWTAVTSPGISRTATFNDTNSASAFFRVRLKHPGE